MDGDLALNFNSTDESDLIHKRTGTNEDQTHSRFSDATTRLPFHLSLHSRFSA
jgi:hypothetical protein